MAAVGAAAILVGVGLVTIGPLAPKDDEAQTPPSSTGAVDGTATPTPANTSDDPTTAPTFTLTRESGLPDATALARMANPRTGETWHAPVERPDYAAAFARYSELSLGDRYFSIGQRNGFDIVVTAQSLEPDSLDPPGSLGSLHVFGGFFEIRSGVPVQILSPTEEVYACGDDAAYLATYHPELVVDTEVFYDSLGYPQTIHADADTTVSVYTWADWDSDCVLGPPGIVLPWERDHGSSTVADFVDGGLTEVEGNGPVELTRLEWASEVMGLNNGSYFVATPYGSLIQTYFTQDYLENAEAIAWLSEHSPSDASEFLLQRLAPAAGDTCWDPTQFTREVDHVDEDWLLAGSTPSGIDVYLPVEGGNDIAHRIYTRMSELSTFDGWAGDVPGPWANTYAGPSGRDVKTEPVPPYHYATYEGFLAANSLVSYPVGEEWFLSIRWEAQYTVFECS